MILAFADKNVRPKMTLSMTSAPIGAWEVNLEIMTDQQTDQWTDRPIDRPTDGHEDS